MSFKIRACSRIRDLILLVDLGRYLISLFFLFNNPNLLLLSPVTSVSLSLISSSVTLSACLHPRLLERSSGGWLVRICSLVLGLYCVSLWPSLPRWPPSSPHTTNATVLSSLRPRAGNKASSGISYSSNNCLGRGGGTGGHNNWTFKGKFFKIYFWLFIITMCLLYYAQSRKIFSRCSRRNIFLTLF